MPFQGSLSPSTPARPMCRSSAASPAITEVDSPPRGVAECSSSVMFSSARPGQGRGAPGAPPFRRRAAPVDSEGYKLADKPDAVWEEMQD